MRLIDADALKKTIRDMPNDYYGDLCIGDALYEINEAPTIDAVPVVRGGWEVAIGYDPNKKVQCQNCYKMAYEPTPHCPNCGAKMEVEP